MTSLASPWTVSGSLLADHDRILLNDEDLVALAGTFPSTRYLTEQPWDPERVIRDAEAAWLAVSESVDPVFQGLAEDDLLPSLPDRMQALTTLRFLLWLWRPGSTIRAAGPFDLALALSCHWDVAHRTAFTRWLANPKLGETRPRRIARIARQYECTPEVAAARLDGKYS